MRVGLLLLALLAVAFLAEGQSRDRVRRGGNRKASPKAAQATAPAAEVATAREDLVVLRGRVVEADNTPLAAAYVQVEGLQVGTTTDLDGTFELSVPNRKLEDRTLSVSYIGYETREIALGEVSAEEAENLEIVVEEAGFIVDAVVVESDRMSIPVVEPVLNIEALSAFQIQSRSGNSAMDAVSYLQGVETQTGGFFLKSFNVRGMALPAYSRMATRIDGADVQAPAFNAPLGGITDAPDLDLQRVEVLSGSASTMYGPNAINGAVNVTTKSPWDYPGFSASLKTGLNHLDQIDRPISSSVQFMARWAKPIRDKVGIKFNVEYQLAEDWVATTPEDLADYTGTRVTVPGTSNPGYDGLSTYGDEVAFRADPTLFSALGFAPAAQPWGDTLRVARTGYRELDLIDNRTFTLRGDAALHYKITKDIELVASSRLSTGQTRLHLDDRLALNGYQMSQTRLGVTGKNFHFLAYATTENSGDSYALQTTGQALNARQKSDSAWVAQYALAFSENPATRADLQAAWTAAGRTDALPTPGDDAAARAFADADNRDLLPWFEANAPALAPYLGGRARLSPNDFGFFNQVQSLGRTGLDDGGTGYQFRNQLYHAEGHYDITPHLKDIMGLEVGGNWRLYRLTSTAGLYGDADNPVGIHEGGGYVRLSKEIVDKRVLVSVINRVDKRQGYKVRVTPRVALVGAFGRSRAHEVNLGFLTGYHLPDLRTQYSNVNLSGFRYVGGSADDFLQNGLWTAPVSGEASAATVSNAFLLRSVDAFLASGNPADLEPSVLRPLEAEFAYTFEFGYKVRPTKQLNLGVNGFVTEYSNLLVPSIIAGPTATDASTPQAELTAQDIAEGNYSLYRRMTNMDPDLTVWGLGFAGAYKIKPQLVASFNYAFQQQEALPLADQRRFVVPFNAPNHVLNLTLEGKLLGDRWSFLLNYRLVGKYAYNYTFASGTVPSFHLLDASVSYQIPRIGSVVTLGGTNLVNDRHIEVYGGPTVGAFTYLQLSFDELLFRK